MADGYEDLIPAAKTDRGQGGGKGGGYEDLVPEKSFGEKYVQPVTDVINRSLIAGTLGAPADIGAMALRPFGYKDEPFLGSEYIGQQMEKAGIVTPKRRPLAELLTSFAPLGATGVVGAGRYGAGLIKRGLGRDVTKEAEAIKKATAERYGAPISEAERQRERAAGVVSQMERQPVVAAERAAKAPLTAQQQAAQLQAQVRQPVREAAGARRVQAEERAARAGQLAERAEQQTLAAQQAVSALEQRMLAQPSIPAEVFGQEIRNVTRTLNKSLIDTRKAESGLSGIIQAAGDTPTVSTLGLITQAKEIGKKSRNPQVKAMMAEIESLAKTGDADALSLYSADSLRKYLSKDIINKFFPQTGADQEVLRGLKSLRGNLIRQMPQDYREALGRFSSLSRPLDIMERQGGLKRVLDIDPISAAEKLTEAQVVGEVINKAKLGNPVFSRLLESSPNLREAARLHFTRDLFGKEVVPSEAAFRNWLATNERPLRQLGLYDEFKSLKSSREAAQRAVDDAKLSEKAAGVVAKEAGKEAERALASGEKRAGEITAAAQKEANAILGTEEPAARVASIITSGDRTLWDRVAPALAAAPKGKETLEAAIRQVMADKATQGVFGAQRFWQTSLSDSLARTGLMDATKIKQIGDQLETIANSTLSEPQKLDFLNRTLRNIVITYAAPKAAEGIGVGQTGGDRSAYEVLMGGKLPRPMSIQPRR